MNVFGFCGHPKLKFFTLTLDDVVDDFRKRKPNTDTSEIWDIPADKYPPQIHNKVPQSLNLI